MIPKNVIKLNKHWNVVFLKCEGDLIIDVESRMGKEKVKNSQLYNILRI
jgi:hypothetical protein